MRLRHRHRQGFTLIELLVVVSIISLLISILLPALSGARRQARATLCGTRLRGLGMAWAAYANENGDRVVPVRLPTFAIGGFASPQNQYRISSGIKYRPRWPALMQAQVGVPAHKNPSRTRDRENYDAPEYVCPEVSDRTDERNAAYGYNYQFLANQRLNSRQLERVPASLSSRITAAAGTVVAGDSMGTAAAFPNRMRTDYVNDGRDESNVGNAAWVLDPPRLAPNSSRAAEHRSAPDPRHRDNANILWADGHVSPETLPKLGYFRLGDGRVLDNDVHASNALWSGDGRDSLPK